MKNKNIIAIIISLIIIIIVFSVFFFAPSFYKDKIKVSTTTYYPFKSQEKIANIISFSDVNLLHDYQIENLDKLVDTINNQNPDIVVFNGDLIAEGKTINAKQKKLIISKLQNIKPLFGKFYISGESDTKEVKDLLFNADFEILDNKVRNISIMNKNFNIIGITKPSSDNKVLNKVKDQQFNLLFLHNPKNIEELQNYKIDCIITGHTLGGEYRLPLYGSIYSDLKDATYNKGKSNLNGIDIHVSNGIGTKYKNLRFNAPSTIEQIILK